MTYSILLPTKKLEQPTLEFLKSAGISVDRDHPRQTQSRISGFDQLTAGKHLRSDLIPMALAKYRSIADFGITTTDVIDEKCVSDIQIVARLKIGTQTQGETRIVFFGKENDASTIQATRYYDEEKEGVPIVATEYPNLTRAFLKKHGMDFRLLEIRGSAETLVLEGFCRYGVTLVETGTTLRVNRLKEIAAICTSCTVLVGNKDYLSPSWGGKGTPREFAKSLCEKFRSPCELS